MHGVPTGRSAGIGGSTTSLMNFAYQFDNTKGNLTSRTDNSRSLSEAFVYDNLNRLTKYGNNTVGYDVKGNIISKSDAGQFKYSNSGKPYAATDVVTSSNSVPLRNQDVTYTSFMRPATISENGYVAAITYDVTGDRVKTHITKDGSQYLTRYYIGRVYESDKKGTTTKEKLYLGGDYYSALVVAVREGTGAWKLYNILRDYLGSVLKITDISGVLVAEYSYDAWGRMRNPANHAVFAVGSEPDLFLGRGYTGHEHMQMFGLVNMNARLYDPVLSRFLSPDPYVQVPDFSQNYNRYSYVINNPLKYTDPDGEFIFGYASVFFKGLFKGKNPFKTGWKTGVNEVKIWAGLFASDKNKNFGERLWEVVSRSTWQLPQTVVGLAYASISNYAWQVDKVDYWGGATVTSGNNWGQGAGSAVTLGSYITGGRDLKADPNNPLFQHEYGHYLQSQEMG